MKYIILITFLFTSCVTLDKSPSSVSYKPKPKPVSIQKGQFNIIKPTIIKPIIIKSNVKSN